MFKKSFSTRLRIVTFSNFFTLISLSISLSRLLTFSFLFFLLSCFYTFLAPLASHSNSSFYIFSFYPSILNVSSNNCWFSFFLYFLNLFSPSFFCFFLFFSLSKLLTNGYDYCSILFPLHFPECC